MKKIQSKSLSKVAMNSVNTNDDSSDDDDKSSSSTSNYDSFDDMPSIFEYIASTYGVVIPENKYIVIGADMDRSSKHIMSKSQKVPSFDEYLEVLSRTSINPPKKDIPEADKFALGTLDIIGSADVSDGIESSIDGLKLDIIPLKEGKSFDYSYPVSETIDLVRSNHMKSSIDKISSMTCSEF